MYVHQFADQSEETQQEIQIMSPDLHTKSFKIQEVTRQSKLIRKRQAAMTSIGTVHITLSLSTVVLNSRDW